MEMQKYNTDELDRRIAGARQIHVKATDAVRCLMCDREISRERLDAIPSVNTCFDCARDIERAARMVA